MQQPTEFDPTPLTEIAPVTQRSLWVAWAAVAAAVLFGVGALNQRIVTQEETHRMRQLELGSQSTVGVAGDLVRLPLKQLEQVASNVAVQLYMTQIAQTAPDVMGGVAPERQYLENLLLATAAKGGFQASGESVVNANVTPARQSGIALLNAQGEVIAATRAMPPVNGALGNFLNDASRTRASASDPVTVGEGGQSIIYQAPIFAVQGDATGANYIGRVVAVKLLDAKTLRPALATPAPIVSTLLLLNEADGAQQWSLGADDLHATPLSGRPLELQAAHKPGHVLRGKDANGRESYAISRPLGAGHMLLLQQMERNEALAEVHSELRWIWIVVGLALLALAALLWAVLRNSAALRALMAAEHYQALVRGLDTKSRLLGLVTAHTPNIITILDDTGRVCFTNRVPPGSGSEGFDDQQGKTLIATIGAEAAKALLARSATALAENKPQRVVEKRETADGTHYIQCLHMPLDSIPVDLPFLTASSRGVLIIEEDITPLMLERERQERTLKRLVDCLVDFVDRRDPYAAQHSLHVSMLARGIAATLNQDEVVQETAELAGSLLNVGKMTIPEQLLAQASALDGDGLKRIREAIASSADIVEGVEFRGPVAESIRQSLERTDGSGPQGLKGDGILLAARIVAVANAYVGMTSPRAYREPLGIETATAQLMQAAGKAFDPAVVAALVHYLRNLGGEAALSDSGKTHG